MSALDPPPLQPIRVPRPMRLAVFASGGGSNLGAILDAIDRGELDGSVALVVADRPGIGALDRAGARGIPTRVLVPEELADPSGAAVLSELGGHEIGAIALAGYLKHVPEPVVQQYDGRMLNVHPSLLPAFGGAGMYGRRVHQAVLDRGCRVSGATVHLVDAGYDTGPIVLQGTVEVRDDDTPESLARRVLAVEHRIFPRALALLAAGRLALDRQPRTGSGSARVRLLPSPSTAPS